MLFTGDFNAVPAALRELEPRCAGGRLDPNRRSVAEVRRPPGPTRRWGGDGPTRRRRARAPAGRPALAASAARCVRPDPVTSPDAEGDGLMTLTAATDSSSRRRSAGRATARSGCASRWRALIALRFRSGRFTRDFDFGGINLLLNYDDGLPVRLRILRPGPNPTRHLQRQVVHPGGVAAGQHRRTRRPDGALLGQADPAVHLDGHPRPRLPRHLRHHRAHRGAGARAAVHPGRAADAEPRAARASSRRSAWT